MDSVSEISDGTTGETGSVLSLEYNIQFIQKKIEDLREETVNNKNRSACAENDKEELMKLLVEDDADSLANIMEMETLRSELEIQRSSNAVLENQLIQIRREISDMNSESDRHMERISQEKKTSEENAKKIQKEMDNLNMFIFDLPNRFSREKLQAEVSAIRADSDRVAYELGLMRNELCHLRGKLENYPIQNVEADSAAVLTEEALRSYEEYVQRTGGDVRALRKDYDSFQKEVDDIEKEGIKEAQKELEEFFGPNFSEAKRYEPPTHDQ